MANFDSEFFGLVFPGFQATQKNSRPKFTSRIVGIPLRFHFLEPKIYSRRFFAYGEDQKIEWGVFGRGGFSNNRFVLKPDVAIASEVSILSKNSLAITDFHAKKTQHVQLFENPLPGTPPFAIPNFSLCSKTSLFCPKTCVR